MPRLQPLDHPDLPPYSLSARLRTQLVYFASEPPPGLTLGEDEYYFPESTVARVLEDGVVELVSPLDTAHVTEVEITEEQEALLQWLSDHAVRHSRVLS